MRCGAVRFVQFILNDINKFDNELKLPEYINTILPCPEDKNYKLRLKVILHIQKLQSGLRI